MTQNLELYVCGYNLRENGRATFDALREAGLSVSMTSCNKLCPYNGDKTAQGNPCRGGSPYIQIGDAEPIVAPNHTSLLEAVRAKLGSRGD